MMGKLHKIRKDIIKRPSHYKLAWGARCEKLKSGGFYIAPNHWHPSYRKFVRKVLEEIDNRGG